MDEASAVYGEREPRRRGRRGIIRRLRSAFTGVSCGYLLTRIGRRIPKEGGGMTTAKTPPPTHFSHTRKGPPAGPSFFRGIDQDICLCNQEKNSGETHRDGKERFSALVSLFEDQNLRAEHGKEGEKKVTG